jgi:hypothetical protein
MPVPQKHTDVTPERIERGLVLLAHVIAMHGDAYVPLFDRLEQELHLCRRRQDTMSRAQEIVRNYTSGNALKAIR